MANKLTQTGVDIVNGETYEIILDVDITSGVLLVSQGTQVIFSSNIIEIENMSEAVDVAENITITII
jgi:hypothetical protein